MKRLLVPVDGSNASLRAVQAAITLIQECSRSPDVHLLTVQAPILSGNVTRFFSAQDIEDYYQEEGNNAITPAKQLLDDAGIAYTAQTLVGHVAPVISDYVKQHDCDHIVMGTRGLGAVSSFVLGSVTLKVLSLVTVPVTLVP